MPEMFFGNNYLRIQHAKSGFSYDFNANEALECVGKHEGQYESVKVAYAKHWSEKRFVPIPRIQFNQLIHESKA